MGYSPANWRESCTSKLSFRFVYHIRPLKAIKQETEKGAMATILYAEDDDAMRKFFEKALEKAGHHVIACSDGERALRALKFADGAFDMLLTDIMMPGLDGIELAKQAEVLSPGIKIMFITGFAAVAKNDVGTSPDARVLSKPIHLRQLVGEIEKLIAA